jgi:hypothetical protein
MKLFKTMAPALALAGLGGCAVYPAPGYDSYGHGSGPYAAEPPVTVYGGGTISYGGSYGYPVPVLPRGYYEGRPPPPPRPHPGPHLHPGERPRPGHWTRHPHRDQDRDGVPDRFDRDRDGDGVGNRYDRRPGNPRQR